MTTLEKLGEGVNLDEREESGPTPILAGRHPGRLHRWTGLVAQVGGLWWMYLGCSSACVLKLWPFTPLGTESLARRASLTSMSKSDEVGP